MEYWAEIRNMDKNRGVVKVKICTSVVTRICFKRDRIYDKIPPEKTSGTTLGYGDPEFC